MIALSPNVQCPLVYLDPRMVGRAQVNAGRSLKDWAIQIDVSYITLQKAINGHGVIASVAKRIAEAMEKDVTDILSPLDPRYVSTKPAIGPAARMEEWSTVSYLESQLAANGLYYIVCRLEHRHTPGRVGRAKFFHLDWLPTATAAETQAKLSRHSTVCERIGSHPNIVTNLSSTAAVGNAGWWVIDRWVGSETLESKLAQGAFPVKDIPRLLLDIASGLAALHSAEIVQRELSPAHVLLSDDGRAVLTDFELAKLFDGSPSVSADWQESPYRAPETVAANQPLTLQADLFSLGHIALAVARRKQSDTTAAHIVLGKAGVPKKLAQYLHDAINPLPKKRPPHLAPILEELQLWNNR